MSYIKLDRKLLNWQWADTPEMLALWIHILLNANYQDSKWHGETYEKGSFPTSIEKLSQQTGLSKMQVRTCLERLNLTHEITSKTTNKGTKISVVNWAFYQGQDYDNNKQNNTQNNKRITNEQQTNNKRITTLKEIKERKEIKNIYNSPFQMGEYDNSNNPQFSEERKQRLKRRRNENKRNS